MLLNTQLQKRKIRNFSSVQYSEWLWLCKENQQDGASCEDSRASAGRRREGVKGAWQLPGFHAPPCPTPDSGCLSSPGCHHPGLRVHLRNPGVALSGTGTVVMAGVDTWREESCRKSELRLQASCRGGH